MRSIKRTHKWNFHKAKYNGLYFTNREPVFLVLLVLLISLLGATVVALSLHKHQLMSWVGKCEEGFDCPDLYVKQTSYQRLPLESFSPVLLERYLHPPPHNPSTSPFYISLPRWKNAASWYEVQRGLENIFEKLSPGFFIEVGALDGQFLSETLYLERRYNWSGLLLEPDPRGFRKLLIRRRNAWLSPLCVNGGYPSIVRFWLRKIEEGLTPILNLVLLSRSKLITEVDTLRVDRGSSIFVPCSPLSPLVIALKKTEIDLLSIGILDANVDRFRDIIFSQTLQVKVLLFRYSEEGLWQESFPRIKGYIRDAKRSQNLVKFYINASYCTLLSPNTCEKVVNTRITEACHLYMCFGHVKVVSFEPNQSV